MRNFDFKKLLPHLIAIGIFLLVTVIFCKPALESGVVLKQSDISSWEAASHQSFEYKQRTGDFPLWVTSMFSGMPAYQIALEGTWTPLSVIDNLFQLWLPKPLNFFFLACISFYFLCLCVRIKPYAAIIGALAFAYCTYSPIIITAGHDTKMLTLGYSPALIGAAILIFQKRYLVGFTLTALFTALEISHSHQQISYYVFLIMAIMSVFFIGQAIRKNEGRSVIKSFGIVLAAGLLGLAVNTAGILPTYDYAKFSKRGGQLVMEDGNKNEKVNNGKTTGLSKEYAFQWSYGKGETLSLMFPGVMGYGSYYAQRDGENYLFPLLKEDANVVTYVTEQFPQAPPDQIAMQLSQSVYWGDQPFTNGPVYLGAVICFLFLFGMFYLDNKHKWWILTSCLLGIFLAWGSHFDAFNTFMFNYLPLYNKFRVPTIALVIPQLLFPLIAALTLSKLSEEKVIMPYTWRKFRNGLFATAAVFVFAFSFYLTSDFGSEDTARTAAFNKLWAAKPADFQAQYGVLNNQYKGLKDNRVYENWVFDLQQNPEAVKVARGIVTALKKDRAAFLMSDLIRSLLFVLAAAGLIAFYIRNRYNAMLLIAGVTLLSAIDLLVVGANYLNKNSFDNKDSYEAVEFPMTAADQTILADKDPNYRVFNASAPSPFEDAKTSYYHKSIGGYHAAKMGIYDDLSAYQMNGNPNPAVLNMLNAKWIITGERGKEQAIRNPDALGNAWFIKGIRFVKGPVAEMKALTGLNTKDSAIVDESYRPLLGTFSPADSAANIRMTAFDNDAISYESNSTAPHLAVFSEIYYKDWKAYIDGKPADYVKANYVLRAMVIPAGKHTIAFKFEPGIFFTSMKISFIASWILLLLLPATAFYEFRKNRREEKTIKTI